jgi:hypothetical protein
MSQLQKFLLLEKSKSTTLKGLVRGTYADAGGYVTEEVLIQFAGPGSGTGQSVWRWSDGWHQCGGRFLLTLKKKRP